MIAEMKEEIKTLVELCEKRASMTSGDRWDVDDRGSIVSVEKERNYAVDLNRFKNKTFIAHARQDIPALCSAIRDIDRERDAWQRLHVASIRLDRGVLDGDMSIHCVLEKENREQALEELQSLGIDTADL